MWGGGRGVYREFGFVCLVVCLWSGSWGWGLGWGGSGIGEGREKGEERGKGEESEGGVGEGYRKEYAGGSKRRECVGKWEWCVDLEVWADESDYRQKYKVVGVLV